MKILSLPCGDNIDDAVHLLEQAKARGEEACIDFNGHMLCSSNVTMDGAYLALTGKTKAECDKRKLREIVVIKAKNAKHKKLSERIKDIMFVHVKKIDREKGFN